MKCQQVREQLADFLAEGLDQSARPAIEEHLGICAWCREEAGMWTRLGALPEEQPGPALRARFDAMLEAYGEGARQAKLRPGSSSGLSRWVEHWWPRQPVFQFAFAVVFLLAGSAAGHLLTVVGSGNQQLTQLREEVHSMRGLVTLSLLQQQSAIERLRGVNWSYRMDQPDREVVSALLNALKYDSSVDVRLAAADALRRSGRDLAVRQGLVEALGRQESPLVQITLIDLMVEMKERQAIDVLRQLQKDTTLNKIVRQRADRALSRLGSGDTL